LKGTAPFRSHRLLNHRDTEATDLK
jgi:hypothetical protein